MRRVIATVVVAVTAGVLGLAAGCGGKRVNAGATGDPESCAAGAGRISIATGNATGVYFALGGGLARVLSEHTPLKATAAETGASVQNIQQLVTGDYDLAFSLADTAADAVAGTGVFTTGRAPVSALTRLYPNHTHVIARTDSGIRSIADLRGRRVSTGSPKSGTEVIARRMLTAAGLDPATDVHAQRLDLARTVDGMKDGTVDALFWSGGLPTAAITDLTVSMRERVTFLDTAALLPRLRAVSSAYEAGVIPGAAYGLPADVPTVVVPNLLLSRTDLPANNACAIVAALYTHKPELERTHQSARGITRDNAANTDPVPLHPGARRALDTP